MNWQPRHTSLIVIATGFGLFFVLFKKEWLLLLPCMAVIGFFIAPLGEWMHRSWMKLALVLGWVNSRILLTVLFYIILTPVALLARLFGKTSIRKKAGNTTSQFVTRNHLYTKTDLQHPW